MLAGNYSSSSRERLGGLRLGGSPESAIVATPSRSGGGDGFGCDGRARDDRLRELAQIRRHSHLRLPVLHDAFAVPVLLDEHVDDHDDDSDEHEHLDQHVDDDDDDSDDHEHLDQHVDVDFHEHLDQHVDDNPDLDEAR
jgi:hypothetical protein